MTGRRPAGVDSFETLEAWIDDEIEGLATSGGITADTRDNLSVEMVLRIARWRSIQSAVVYTDWAAHRSSTDPRTETTPAATWKAGRSVDQYDAATERLRNLGVSPEPVEFDVKADTLQFMADRSEPIARLTTGFVVAPKLRIVKDKQATLVATGSADPGSAAVIRDEIVPPEEAALERGIRLLEEALDADHGDLATVEETAGAFLAVAQASQERTMAETGEVDPTTVC